MHPEGHSVVLVIPGKPFALANWEGAVPQHGEPNGVRYRLAAGSTMASGWCWLATPLAKRCWRFIG
jgi:tricorn protease-like protein